VHFAILSDFADTRGPDTPEDAAILERARAGVEALNLKFGADHADRFFLFHRARQWNTREDAWIGWERKRGKIEEFNRLLRGATDTTFSTQVGSLDVLPSIRYCITLDSDTRLPRDAAKRLIGIIAHPLNQPQFDRRLGRVTAGYGILQPRARAAATPVGPRRLADSLVVVSVRAVTRRPAAEQAAAHRALEDPRQPAAQPVAARDPAAARARVDRSAGTTCGVDARRAVGCGISVAVEPDRESAGPAARAVVGRLPARNGRGSPN